MTTYVDYSNWERRKEISHKKGLKGTKGKEVDDDEMEDFEEQMQKCILNDNTMSIMDVQDDDEAEGAIPGLKIFGSKDDQKPDKKPNKNPKDKELNDENKFQKLKAASTVLKNREVDMKGKDTELKSHPHYQGMKNTTKERVKELSAMVVQLDAACISKKATLEQAKKILEKAKVCGDLAANHMKTMNAIAI